MEVLIFQKEAFEEMAAKSCRFTERMDAILAKQGDKSMNGWMDNQEVCQQLSISPRTLQTQRDNDTLAYSQINHGSRVFPSPNGWICHNPETNWAIWFTSPFLSTLE